MKQLLFFSFLFSAITSFAQSTVTYDKIIARKGISVSGKGVDDIQTDTAFSVDTKVPSSKAIKDFVAGRVGAVAGGSAGVTWTAKNKGITGTGDKTAALQTLFNTTSVKTIWTEETQNYTIAGTLNGTGKTLQLSNGAKLSGSGTLSNILISAQNEEIFDTSLTVDNILNTTIYASWFGFSPSASAAKNTKALQRISALINSMSGGVRLEFQKGTYNVGKERFANNAASDWAFMSDTLFNLKGCTKPVIIEGNGAVIKLSNGLHFGSFNPSTGIPYNPPAGPYYGPAGTPNCIFDLRYNESITIQNIKLDGNVPNLVIGGRWDDDGIQLPGDGILSYDNNYLKIDNVVSFQCPRDGIQIVNSAGDLKKKKTVSIYNSVFDGNVRQGMSVVGCRQLISINNQFINTGKTYNAGKGTNVRSSPAAGVDLEVEAGPIEDIHFINSYWFNNDGAGLLGVGDIANLTVVDSRIIGSSSWALYSPGTGAVFENTTIVGSVVNLFEVKFKNCLITSDSTLSPNGQVHGLYTVDLAGGMNSSSFYNCTIDGGYRRSFVYGGANFYDCVFKRPGGYCFISGNFFGVNHIYWPGGVCDNPNSTNSRFYGPVYYHNTNNGDVVDISGLNPDSIRKVINKGYIGSSRSSSGKSLQFKNMYGGTDSIEVKTVNGNSILGPGNLIITGGVSSSSVLSTIDSAFNATEKKFDGNRFMYLNDSTITTTGLADSAATRDSLAYHNNRLNGLNNRLTIVEAGGVSGKQNLSEKGQPNGYAPLDILGKIPNSYLYSNSLQNLFKQYNGYDSTKMQLIGHLPGGGAMQWFDTTGISVGGGNGGGMTGPAFLSPSSLTNVSESPLHTYTATSTATYMPFSDVIAATAEKVYAFEVGNTTISAAVSFRVDGAPFVNIVFPSGGGFIGSYTFSNDSYNQYATGLGVGSFYGIQNFNDGGTWKLRLVSSADGITWISHQVIANTPAGTLSTGCYFVNVGDICKNPKKY